MIDLADAEKDGWVEYLDYALFSEFRITLYRMLRRNKDLLSFVQCLPRSEGRVVFSMSSTGAPEARLLVGGADILPVEFSRKTLRDVFVRDERATRAVLALLGYGDREVSLYGVSAIMKSILMGMEPEQVRRASFNDVDDALMGALLGGRDE
jgi:hypothetical protein